MAETLDGLFGPTPLQIQQQQYDAQKAFAGKLAGMDSLQQAKYGAAMAGSGIGGMLGDAMGMVNPQMQQAKRQEQIMSTEGTDLSSSKGLLAKADEFRKAGDLRTAMALTLKGKEIEKQEQAAALAGRKQDEQENFRRDQMTEQMDIRRQQLTQQAEAARLRSEDRQASVEQRAEASREANASKLQIAQLMAEMRRMGIESKGTKDPMTPAQAFKQKQAEAKSAGQLRGMDNSFENLTSAANAIVNHPGLGNATGILGILTSMPGGDAAQVDNLLSEFKSGVKKTGLDLVRQGGGIGAMSEKEWPIVEGMVADINPKAGKDAVVSQMQKVLAKVDQVRQNAYQTHNEGFDRELSPRTVTATPGKPTAPATPSAPIYASNGKVRIMSTDGGKTWQPAGGK